MHTLQVGSGNLNFLEGCYHAYLDGNNEFPGVVISTGTEGLFIWDGNWLLDYFDSAWYFNGGEFHLPVAGFTHYETTSDYVTWSAYRFLTINVMILRFHDMDPLWFNDGFQLIWRNGDMLDPTGS